MPEARAFRPTSPVDWLESERVRFRQLLGLRLPVHLELGLHPETHVCAACTAARAIQRVAVEERAPLIWTEVASVLPGQEGVAAPPPWLRVLLPGEEVGPVRFLGPVRGDLAQGLVETVRDLVAAPAPSMEGWEEVRARLKRRHHFRIYAAWRCADAPAVIRHLARLVHAAPDRLALDVVDAESFPRDARKHGVRMLPTVTVDDFGHFYGNPDEQELAHTLLDILPSGNLPYPSTLGGGPGVGL